jgi:hypothetical protein
VRTRLPLAAALAAAVATSAAGHAAPAPKPQITDPAGDAKVPYASVDVVSALYRTTGETTTRVVKGRKVTTYTPKKLVVTLNLAGAPLTNPGAAYEVGSQVAGCGAMRFTYTPGTVTGQVLGDASVWLDCGEPDPTTGSSGTLLAGTAFTLGPKSITWTVTIKTLPKPVTVGSKLSDFRAAVDVVEPVFGLEGTNLFPGASIDEGLGTGTWTLR